LLYNESMAKKNRLVVPKKGKVFLGVAAAFAQYFNVDVTIVRIVWVLLLLPGGLPGLIPYIICWLLIPEQE
jgi:phage shock protein C